MIVAVSGKGGVGKTSLTALRSCISRLLVNQKGVSGENQGKNDENCDFEGQICADLPVFWAKGVHFTPRAGQSGHRPVAGPATTDASQFYWGKGGGLNRNTS